MSEIEEVQQAAAIVIDRSHEKPKVLIVTGQKHPEHWIFPKGHVDPGEEAPQSAVREAREEAGVAAHVIAPLGCINYVSDGEAVGVSYFLCDLDEIVDEGEKDRKKKWCTFAEAATMVTFEESVRMLQEASIYLKQEDSDMDQALIERRAVPR